MQGQIEIVKEGISTFHNDRKRGKKQLFEWFLNHAMEEEARIQVSAEPYERSDEKKAHRNIGNNGTILCRYILKYVL